MFNIIPFENKYRDDAIFCLLTAKDALGRVPKINEDLLNIRKSYFDRGDMFWLALSGAGRVVGMVGTHTVSPSEMWLKRLYVMPSLKRQGIASALLETAKVYARQKGICVIHTRFAEDYREAACFYHAKGFCELPSVDGLRHMCKEIGGAVKTARSERAAPQGQFHQKNCPRLPHLVSCRVRLSLDNQAVQRYNYIGDGFASVTILITKGMRQVKLLYKGKTKNVLKDEATGKFYLFFKDDATGEDGVFDPGSNTVGGSVAGKGKVGLAITQHFFELMEANGIPTHYLGADLDQCLMQVRQVTVPKLEFVLRYFTAGSMCRRFTLEPGIPFDPPYLEVTLKDDEQGDPLISDRLCRMKGMLNEGEYQKALDLLVKIGDVLRKELAAMHLKLIDFKVEFGFDADRNIYIADEITPDIWRVQDEQGNIPNQIDCAKIILERINGKA